MYKLNGATGDKTGLGITLRVMAGDNVSIYGKSYWTGSSPNNSYTTVVNDLLTALAATSAVANAGKGATAAALTGSGVTPSDVSNFLSTAPLVTGRPKAYINWILFDEQFRAVSSSSGFSAVNSTSGLLNTHTQSVGITKNGYLYVYCSNESNIDVFFDNLQVIQIRGPLLEETHYYPWGLALQGISSQAAGKLENKYKYNGGSELQHKEFSDGSGLEMYDTHFRNLDPQLGRWWQVDPKPNESESPYASMGNNPISNNDPLGDTTMPGAGFWRNAWEGLKDGGKSTAAFVKSLGTKEGWQNLANGISALEGMDPQSVNARTEMGMQVVNGVKNIPNMTKDDWGHAVGFGAEKVVEGALLSKGAGMLKNAVAGASAETQVYRVFGGDAAAEGYSWTPVNPNSVSNFRDAAGLPSGGASGSTNTGRFVIEGTVKNKNILSTRSALPLDGNKGGLPEFIIKPKNVTITRVSGVNPNF